VYNYDRGLPQFIDCRFIENSADYGGAIVDRVGVRSAMTGCVFENNTARWRAGALYLDYGARPNLTDCRFTGNRSDCHGGAVAAVSRASQLEATIPVFKNCSFAGNRAKTAGGAIANFDNSILGLDHCTLSDNQAGQGGGAIALQFRARAVLVDCQLSGNRADQGPADLAPDETSTVSDSRRDWPDQTAPPRPAGFGPPPR
jgi:predicted outer membrane repeat protein